MNEARPPLAAFETATFEAVATATDVTVDDLRTLVARHQEGVRALPGVEDIVYEWRSQFHEDPLVYRSPSVYVLAHRSHVWEEFRDQLDLDDVAYDALLSVHDRQARDLVERTNHEAFDDREALVLTRP